MSTTTTEKITYALVMTHKRTGRVFTTWVFDNKDDAIAHRNDEIERRNSDEFRARVALAGCKEDPMTLRIDQTTEVCTVTTETIWDSTNS